MTQEDAEIGRRHVAPVEGRSPRVRTFRRSPRVVPSTSSVVQRPSSVSKPARPSSSDDRPRLVVARRGCPGSRTCPAGPPVDPSSGSIQAIASSCSTRSPVMTTRSARQSRAGVDNRFEEQSLEARSQVEVADLDDLKAVERAPGGRARSRPTRADAGGTTGCRAGAAAMNRRPAPIRGRCPGRRAEVDSSGRAGDALGPAPAGESPSRTSGQRTSAGDHAQEGVTPERPRPRPPRVVQVFPEQERRRRPRSPRTGGSGRDPSTVSRNPRPLDHVDHQDEMVEVSQGRRDGERQDGRPRPVRIHGAMPRSVASPADS